MPKFLTSLVLDYPIPVAVELVHVRHGQLAMYTTGHFASDTIFFFEKKQNSFQFQVIYSVTTFLCTQESYGNEHHRIWLSGLSTISWVATEFFTHAQSDSLACGLSVISVSVFF